MGSTKILWAVVAALVVASCSKHKTQQVPTPVGVSTAPAPVTPVANNDDADRLSREEAMRREEARRMRDVLEQRVYFALDESTLDAQARTTLDGKTLALRTDPQIRLRIEGHADERGSVEYNLALAMRRARGVEQYLTGFGVASTRLESVSLGEERPAAPGHDEAAWSQNRRAEFRVQSSDARSAQ